MHESGTVNYAIPGFILQVEAFDDPLYPNQWQLNGPWVTNGPDGTVELDIDAPEAWQTNTGSSDVIVAVYDDGLEPHEDLPTILPGWYVQTILMQQNDPLAFDALSEEMQTGVCFEFSKHGEAVAGIIAAQHNEVGCRGVAPGVTLLPIKLNLDLGMFINFEGVTQSFYSAADQGAAVINCSWGLWSCEFEDPSTNAAIHYATTSGRNGLGSVVVFSSGNYQQDFDCVLYPASHPDVIAVGAISAAGVIEIYSQYGEHLDMVAPVGDVTTLDRMGLAGYTNNNYMDFFGGTSAAAPMVSGAAALLISEDPTLTEGQVRQLLYESCSDLGVDGWDPLYGHGNLNIGLAMSNLVFDPCGDVTGYDYTDLVISTGQTVQIISNTSFQHTLSVEAGGQLTVAPNVVLSFGPDAKFIIDDGASVSLVGVILKNFCESKMWWGFEIWDDIEIEDQYIDEFGNEITVFGTPVIGGHLSIRESKVWNAHFAITTGRMKEPEEWFFEYEPETMIINEGEFNEAEVPIPNPNYIRAPYFAWKDGGTLACSDNEFINCAVGIFVPGSTYGVPKAISEEELAITDCDFVTTGDGLIDPAYTSGGFDEYPNPGNLYNYEANSEGRSCIGILAHGVKASNGTSDPFEITDCTFNNLECGIKTVNSYFDIKDNTFNNLQYGIHMAGANLNGIYVAQTDIEISGNSFTEIYDPNPEDMDDQTTFPVVQATGPWNYYIDAESSNTAAFRADNVPGIQLINNDFGLSNPIEENFETHTNAIYLNNCSDFDISNSNEIFNFKRGIITLDADKWVSGGGLIGTGELGEENNIVHGCEQALITGQDNYNLLVRCNSFSQDPDEEFLNILLWQNAGVMGHQGSEPPVANPGDNTTGAGNTFTPIDYTDYKSIIAEQIVEGGEYDFDWEDMQEIYGDLITEEAWSDLDMGFIYYHYGDDDSETNEHRPIKYDNLSDVEIAALYVTYEDNVSCDSPYNIIDDDGGNLITLVSANDIAERIETEKDYLVEFIQMLDDYNSETASMLNAIYGGIQNEYDLMNYLMANSPLSAEVLGAYMERNNVPSAYFAQVFELNSIVDAQLAAMLEQQVSNMPQAIAEYLLRITYSNPYIETTSKIRRRITEYEKIYQHVVMDEVNDLMTGGNKAAAVALLQSQQGIHPKQIIANIHTSGGDYNDAKDVLHTITAPQAIQWKQLKVKQIDHFENGTIPTQQEIKEVLDETSSNETCGQAQGMLEGIGVEFCMVIPHVDMNGPRATTVAKSEAIQDALAIYPNPASDYFRVALPLGLGVIVQLQLTDNTGRVVMQKAYTTSNEDLLIEVQDLIEGNYGYRISTVDQQQVWTGNIQIK
ncbi:MAG: S8 family serine peptidase [Flavobacteriales bacterium]